MSAAGTAQISELTISWINDQLRRELLRRMMENAAPVSDTNWRRQMMIAVTALVSGVCLIIKSPFI